MKWFLFIFALNSSHMILSMVMQQCSPFRNTGVTYKGANAQCLFDKLMISRKQFIRKEERMDGRKEGIIQRKRKGGGGKQSQI